MRLKPIFFEFSEGFDFRFVYESTGQEPFYVNWKSGQPKDKPGQDCVKVHMEANNQWFDDHCDHSHYFVCEKGIPEFILYKPVCTISFYFFKRFKRGILPKLISSQVKTM